MLYSPTIMTDFFGRYLDFDTASKKDAGILLGADNAVGDIYQVHILQEDGVQRAWFQNAFGQRVGYLEPDISRKLKTLQAEGLEMVGILAFVAFTDHPDEGHYWGQMAVICYPPQESTAFGRFVEGVSARLGEGNRPKVDLGAEGVAKIRQTEGAWMPSQTVPLPKSEKGTAYLKQRRKLSERMIDKGRAGNKGCYVVSWVFLLALVTLVVFLVYSCAAG